MGINVEHIYKVLISRRKTSERTVSGDEKYRFPFTYISESPITELRKLYYVHQIAVMGRDHIRYIMNQLDDEIIETR
jgi:hypothetical protein